MTSTVVDSSFKLGDDTNLLEMEQLVMELDSCLQELQKQKKDMDILQEEIQQEIEEEEEEQAKFNRNKSNKALKVLGVNKNIDNSMSYSSKAMKLMGFSDPKAKNKPGPEVQGFVDKLYTTTFAKKFKRRYLVLNKGKLLIYKQPPAFDKEEEEIQPALEELELTGSTKISMSTTITTLLEGYPFIIANERDVWTLQANNSDDLTKWYRKVRAAISNKYGEEIANMTFAKPTSPSSYRLSFMNNSATSAKTMINKEFQSDMNVAATSPKPSLVSSTTINTYNNNNMSVSSPIISTTAMQQQKTKTTVTNQQKELPLTPTRTSQLSSFSSEYSNDVLELQSPSILHSATTDSRPFSFNSDFQYSSSPFLSPVKLMSESNSMNKNSSGPDFYRLSGYNSYSMNMVNGGNGSAPHTPSQQSLIYPFDMNHHESSTSSGKRAQQPLHDSHVNHAISLLDKLEQQFM